MLPRPSGTTSRIDLGVMVAVAITVGVESRGDGGGVHKIFVAEVSEEMDDVIFRPQDPTGGAAELSP